MLKEYLQLLILDFLSTTPYIGKISFIGGTNLRLVKGIDRFSEDLDFDCKNLSSEEFTEMTNAVINFLQRSGYHIEVRDKESTKLKAFRRNIHFPELLYILGLSGHKDERFLIKLECQDQQVDYKRSMVNIKGCGFFFPFPVPTDGVLCSMKISAMLSRQKGRDFYDSMFLLSFTTPNYQFLTAKLGIHDFSELKMATKAALNTVDLNLKRRDFEHLLFSRKNSERILSFWDFLQEMK
jgi:predicted nucleotidyltransferase component of viral defense system